MRYFLIVFAVTLLSLNSYAESEHNMNAMSQTDSPVLSDKPKKEIWTCSMHPQIRSDKPGRCPICGMKLIPLAEEENSHSANLLLLTLSPAAVKLAGIEVAPVIEQEAFAETRLVGKIEFNETRNVTISAKFAGRIEKLYLNYVGAPITKGEHIAAIFSPSIAVLQRELILTKKNYEDANPSSNQTKTDDQKAYNAAINKAGLWGLTDAQIDEVLNRGTVSQTMTLFSPVMGIVKTQNVMQNQYFKEGDILFVISDLSNLWLMLDAYEQDLPYLHYGQHVEFKVEAFPGKVFHGTIAYINPTVDDTTRTVQIRVIVDNKDGKLKPGMFARATVFSHIGTDGVALSENMDGKWICPMHPEIIEGQSGNCPICGMNLESAEQLGLSDDKRDEHLPILIPANAPLITGKRSIVYVEIKPGQFEGREIALGPKVGNYYIVEKGIKVGEKVVVKGNFKIDSELQIQAKPSMMNDSTDNQAQPISHQH